MTKLKNLLISIIKGIFYQANIRISQIGSLYCIEPLLLYLLQKQEKVFIVQIGANDGKMSDPLYPFIMKHKKRVEGVLIEPMKEVFESLKTNYRNCPKIKLLNVAIHKSEKEMKLYKVNPLARKVPEWSKGIASFNKDHHLISKTNAEHMVVEIVRCISFEDMVNDNGIDRIDLLQIDTEGYDSEIIRSIEFGSIKPRIIRFEHGLNSGIMDGEEFFSIIKILKDNDYDVIYEHQDVTAYQLKSVVSF